MRSCVCVFCHALCDLNFSACGIPPSDIHGAGGRGGGGEEKNGGGGETGWFGQV